MIVGIAGRLGSGKDEVAKIIQDLTSPVIEDYGKWENGEWIPMKGSSPWKIKKFAGALKQIASIFTGIPVEKFEDQEFKKTNLGSEWGNMTIRSFLQKLGTDAIRNGLHDQAWINALMSHYKPILDTSDGVARDKYPNWLVSDVRFNNEAQAIKDRGGLVIRINRGPELSSEERAKLHPSETSLDDWKFDYIINNDRGLIELRQEVEIMLDYFKLI